MIQKNTNCNYYRIYRKSIQKRLHKISSMMCAEVSFSRIKDVNRYLTFLASFSVDFLQTGDKYNNLKRTINQMNRLNLKRKNLILCFVDKYYRFTQNIVLFADKNEKIKISKNLLIQKIRAPTLWRRLIFMFP